MIISLKDNFELSLNTVENDLEYFTYPIFQWDNNNRPELIATSVAVQLGGSYFLCTAAHVLENRDGRPLFIGNSKVDKKGSLIGLTGKVVYSKRDFSSETDYDLCLIDVRPIKDKLHFLNQEKIKIGPLVGRSAIHILLGYPISKNKTTRIVNTDTNEVKTGFQTVAVKVDENIDLSIFEGINSRAHIAFNYNVDHLKQPLPFPKGISGGGIWHVPNIYDLRKFYLAGIFIEYHAKEKIGICTKALFIKSLSEKFEV